MIPTALIALALGLQAAPGPRSSDPKYPYWPWVSAGEFRPPDAVQMTMWINMETIRRVADHTIEVWFKFENSRPDEDHAMNTLVYERLDCARNFHSAISLQKYDARGQVVFSKLGQADHMEPVVPDTLLAGMMPFTCAAGGMSG